MSEVSQVSEVSEEKVSRGRKPVDYSPWKSLVSENVKQITVSEQDVAESIGKGRIPDVDRQILRIARIEKLLADVDSLKSLLPGEYRKLAVLQHPSYSRIREENRAKTEGNPEKKMERTKNFLKSLDAESLQALLAELNG